MMNARNLNRIATRFREIGPYVLLALLVPGGSVLALLLWRHQRGRRGEPT